MDKGLNVAESEAAILTAEYYLDWSEKINEV